MADFVTGNDIRVGVKVVVDGAPYQVLKSQLVKTANRRAVMQTTLRNLLTGQVLDRNFHSGDKLERADITIRHMQFLYSQGDEFVFMDNETYEQTHLDRSALDELSVRFLKENTEVEVLHYEGRPVSVELPSSMNFRITHTEPGVRGDTATNVTKPATIETGATIKVPIFINEGDVIKVDTRTGDYLERVKIA
jgi:elongation factor P